MPAPKPNEETKKEFIDRCIPIVLDEGTAKDGKQAKAICENYWEQYKENKAMTQTIERRVLGVSSIEMRQEENEKPKLVGYPAVFNSLSENLGGFREKISPGAFADSIGNDADVRAFWNHNSDMVLGRTKAGTLRVKEDDYGLYAEIDPPESAAALLESVKRGDVNQMSFGFRVNPDGDRFDADEDGMIIRTLLSVQLLEVSPVAFPAYLQTSVDARTLERVKNASRVKPATLVRTRVKRKALERHNRVVHVNG